MSEKTNTRVKYYSKQYLGSRDFKDEQAYHRDAIQSHATELHDPGIVKGLELMWGEENDRFVVTPGVAVAPDGVVIRLSRRYEFNKDDDFDRRDSDILKVHLGYREDAGTGRPRGYSVCRDSGGIVSDRIQLSPFLQICEEGSSFEPVKEQCIFLGKMIRNFSNPDAPYSVDLSGRMLSGLIGARVTAPSNRACIKVGSSENRPFALCVPGGSGSLEAGKSIQGNQGKEEEPEFLLLEVEVSSGKPTMKCHGDAEISGDVRLENGALQFAGEMDESSEKEWAEKEWTLYRKKTEKKGGSSVAHLNEWRLALPDANGAKAHFTIGYFKEDSKKFTPVATFQNEGRAVFHGDVEVQGAFKSSHESPELTPAAKNMLFSGILLGGADRRAELLKEFRESLFRGELAILQTAVSKSKSRETILNLIIVNDPVLNAFVEELVEELAKNEKQGVLIRKILGHENGPAWIAKGLCRKISFAQGVVTWILEHKPGEEALRAIADLMVDVTDAYKENGIAPMIKAMNDTYPIKPEGKQKSIADLAGHIKKYADEDWVKKLCEVLGEN